MAFFVSGRQRCPRTHLRARQRFECRHVGSSEDRHEQGDAGQLGDQRYRLSECGSSRPSSPHGPSGCCVAQTCVRVAKARSGLSRCSPWQLSRDLCYRQMAALWHQTPTFRKHGSGSELRRGARRMPTLKLMVTPWRVVVSLKSASRCPHGMPIAVPMDVSIDWSRPRNPMAGSTSTQR